MLLYPSYFGTVIQYVVIANADNLLFETQDNYQKQTYRNRCYIYGANGRQMLNIPIIHLKNSSRSKTRDVQIDNSFSWQNNHIQSLNSAYHSSPFYEFYKDDIIAVIEKKYRYLLDLNFDTLAVVKSCLQLELPFEKTKIYKLTEDDNQDFRKLIDAKLKINYSFKKYIQVFDNKYGFISNLSILDLLFNEGPNSLQYLEDHKNLLV